MTEGSSLINLGDLSKPATVLIEKVCNAVGIVYEPTRIRRQATAVAAAERTIALSRIEISDLERRAIERLVSQEARKQDNIEKIAFDAATAIRPDAKPEKIDEDWIAHFFDQCANVSNVEMQALWSRLLADEAAAPGSISKRTVNLVATLDKADATLFSALCQFAWDFAGPVPIIFDPDAQIYQNQGLTFIGLKHLDSIGLISFDSLGGYQQFTQQNMRRMRANYFGQPHILEFTTDIQKAVEIGKVIFTHAGQQLFTVINPQQNPQFVSYAVSVWAEKHIAVSCPIPRM